MTEKSLDELYSRPGFMLRRAHQIAVSIFESVMADLKLSPTQFALLYILATQPGIDQITLGHVLGIDRSTTTLVARLLESNGYITRQVSAKDRRRKQLKLTRKGHALLNKADKLTALTSEKILSPFDQDEARKFLELLDKLTGSLNSISRTPIKRQPSAASAAD